MIGRVRRALASGWIPAATVVLVAALVLRDDANVGFRDIALFTAWFGWGFTVPGLVLWRLLDWRRGSGDHRPFLEDVVLGSMLGIVAAIAVYLALVAAGVPHLVLAWPLLVLAPAVSVRQGRSLLARRQATQTPLWFSWSLAVVVLYAVLHVHHFVWAADILTNESLRSPYVDEPYHLSLVAEFRHHFPAQVPYVEGTPLRYHWLVYPFIAASSWGSSVTPIVLLRLLGPTALVALPVLGVAVAARRISGRSWAGVIGAGLVCVVTPLDLMGWTPTSSPTQTFAWAPFASPTQVLANALCPLLIVLLVDVMRGSARRWWHWSAAGVVMLAVAGAKSAMLPLFVAGLVGTVAVLLVVRRRIEWRVAGLAAMSGFVFLLATKLFYGSGSRALTLKPFQVVDNQALVHGLVESGQTPSSFVRAALTVVFVLAVALPLAGALGLLVKGGWRLPIGWMLGGAWACGLVVVLAFHHPGFGQYYFLESAVVPGALLAALGWERAAGPMTRRLALSMAGVVASGIGLGFLIPAVTSTVPPERLAGSNEHRVLVDYGIPLGLGVVAVVLAWLACLAVARRWKPARGRAVLVAAGLAVGMSLTFAVSQVATAGRAPVAPGSMETISPGGLRAALWLRSHSDVDDIIATNAHTRLRNRPTDHRAFWISAYAERRVLVEGWAYVPPESVGLPSNDVTNASAGGPFWDLPRLRLNDEVFTHPTATNIAELHEKYGVDWLFADRRRGADLEGLARLTTERLRTPDCVVFRIKP